MYVRAQHRSTARMAGCLGLALCVMAPNPALAQADGAAGEARGPAGNYRTLCVRTCDGYYFPVSYGVSSAVFERDEKACSALCQGTHLELHYQEIPGEDVGEAVSVSTGRTYSELPTAFDHRRTGERPAGCGCGARASEPGTAGYSTVGGGSGGFEIIGGDYGRPEEPQEPERAAAVPRPGNPPLPATAPGPERVAGESAKEVPVGNSLRLSGPAVADSAAPQRTRAAEPEEDPAQRDVRVVGPGFFPDREEAIDLQARDPYRAR